MGTPSTIVIDTARWTVTHDGRLVPMVRREFELLRYLVQHPDRTFRRKELLDAVWQGSEAPHERTIDSYVAKLRRKLGPSGEALIRTVPKVGYRADLRHDGVSRPYVTLVA